MKAVELTALSADELLGKIDELQEDLYNLKVRNATKELENTATVGETRKDIARVKTILRVKHNIMV